MLRELAEHISLKLVTTKTINIDDREFYTYGLELLLSKTIFCSIILIFALITNTLLISAMFLFMYMLIRQYSGGFHCKTSEMCFLVSILLYLLMLFLVRIDFNQIETSLCIFSTVSFFIIAVFSPIVSENNPLSPKQKIKYRRYSIIIAFLWLSIMVCTYIFKLDYIFYPVSWSLSVDAVLILLTLRRNKNEKDNAQSSSSLD